jgi:hypothetical protein
VRGPFALFVLYAYTRSSSSKAGPLISGNLSVSLEDPNLLIGSTTTISQGNLDTNLIYHLYFYVTFVHFHTWALFITHGSGMGTLPLHWSESRNLLSFLYPCHRITVLMRRHAVTDSPVRSLYVLKFLAVVLFISLIPNRSKCKDFWIMLRDWLPRHNVAHRLVTCMTPPFSCSLNS